MLVTQPFTTTLHAPEQPDTHFMFPIPRVYEKAEPVRWEYHVLTLDTREESLPDVTLLDELGQDGWLLAGIVDQGATGKSSLVHYYFVRLLEK